MQQEHRALEDLATLKAELTALRGYWVPFWDDILALDPTFLEAYVRFSGIPFTSGRLPPIEKELILVALNASATHLYEPGLRAHIRNALEHGASADQVMGVFQLAAVLGVQTIEMAIPLLESREEASWAAGADPGDLERAFAEAGVPWDRSYSRMAASDAGYLRAYLRLAAAAWQNPALSPRLRELISIAINGSATHLHEAALKRHIGRALAAGAAHEEIIEALELTSVVGIHACTTGVPILLEEMAALDARQR